MDESQNSKDASPEGEAPIDNNADSAIQDTIDEIVAEAVASAEAGEAPAEQADDSPTDSLEAKVAALTEQLANAKDDQLRVQAEMQNLRRRAERDVESAHKFGLEKIINGLLPVLDNLDRAIGAVPEESAGDDGVKALLEGVELTRKTALDVLTRFSVDVLEPFGEPFDPQFHEAMTMVPSPTAEPNSVIDVLQKGYTLNGRLLRAAMVVIAKPE
ncbi:MAG: nucleotide exchange factor GrpE [Cellvibrionales bacterium]|nr:nucleotide exchange factor GrpE [Cellvibrionales bacterium]MBT5923900.1 nucleotide exchange factor GrpE [Cellvibrionales bacterium]MBT6578972.1 nucleotide exchange factor GrpE [Cellvibrionales bacterium]